jgi:predicted amidohydrolase YtcJ
MEILYNAHIYTLEDSQPIASAIAIEHGCVVAVGGMENRLGKLTPGYLADFIILAQDPFVTSPVDLLGVESSATMVGDEWVWQS